MEKPFPSFLWGMDPRLTWFTRGKAPKYAEGVRLHFRRRGGKERGGQRPTDRGKEKILLVQFQRKKKRGKALNTSVSRTEERTRGTGVESSPSKDSARVVINRQRGNAPKKQSSAGRKELSSSSILEILCRRQDRKSGSRPGIWRRGGRQGEKGKKRDPSRRRGKTPFVLYHTWKKRRRPRPGRKRMKAT